jgi:hypothetical protein
MEDSSQLYTFYEVPVFTARLARFAGGDEALQILYAIQADLLADPIPQAIRARAAAFVICTWNIAARFTCFFCLPSPCRLT